MRQLAVCSLLLLFACRGHETSLPQRGNIRIGLITGLTGPTAAWGEPTRNGAAMAVDDINKRGGVRGRRVELLVEDDAGKPEQSAAVATKLITRDDVIALVCCDSSSRSLAAAPIAQSYGTPMVSPTSSLPAVTKVGDTIFRVCPTDDFEAAVLARLAVDRLHAKRAAILRDSKNDYSVGVAAEFTAAMQRLGGTVVQSRDYSEGDSDFRGQLVSLREAKPDVLLLPGYYADVAQIALQARDLDFDVPLIGGSAWNSPALVEIGGKAIEGSLFVAPAESRDVHFTSDYEKRFHKAADAPTALSYDAVALIATSIDRAATADRKATRDAIATTKQFRGASGTFDIGPDRNPRKPLGLYEVRGGKIKQIAEVNP